MTDIYPIPQLTQLIEEHAEELLGDEGPDTQACRSLAIAIANEFGLFPPDYTEIQHRQEYGPDYPG